MTTILVFVPSRSVPPVVFWLESFVSIFLFGNIFIPARVVFPADSTVRPFVCFCTMFAHDFGVEFPVKDNKTVQLYDDDFKDEKDAIMRLLRDESPAWDEPGKVFANLAQAFFQVGDTDTGLQVIKMGTGLAAAKKDTKGEGFLLLAHGSHFARLFQENRRFSSRGGDENYEKAKGLIERANRLLLPEVTKGEADALPLFNARGFLNLLNDDAKNAKVSFNATLDLDSEDLAATMGLAILYFREGNYKAALKNFSKVLEKCPDSDNSVRVALGHCNYHLGRKDQAKAWYKRAHEVDGTNSDALACMAVLDMADSAAPSAEEVRGQVEKLFAAHKYDPTNALAMNSLAEHFFNKQQYNKVIELCTRAVGKTRVKENKARSYLLIARTYHIQGNLEQASKF